VAVLWEWNGTDTSQFDEEAAFLNGWSGITLSVVADAKYVGGNKLRLNGTTTGPATGVWFITQTIVQLNRTIMFDYEVADSNAAYGGISFLGEDGDSVSCINYAHDNFKSYVEFGGLAANSNTNNGIFTNARHGRARIILRSDLISGGGPRFTLEGTAQFRGSNETTANGTFNGALFQNQLQWAELGAFGNWDSITPNRVGIYIQRGANTGTSTLDFTRLRIIDDPFSGATTATPPVVTFATADGSTLAGNGAVTLSVTDADDFSALLVAIEFSDGTYEVVHDGAAFAGRYDARSTRTAIEGGYTYVLDRDLGWPRVDSFTVKVFPVDTLGATS
jgi:hypothetical protein